MNLSAVPVNSNWAMMNQTKRDSFSTLQHPCELHNSQPCVLDLTSFPVYVLPSGCPGFQEQRHQGSPVRACQGLQGKDVDSILQLLPINTELSTTVVQLIEWLRKRTSKLHCMSKLLGPPLMAESVPKSRHSMSSCKN